MTSDSNSTRFESLRRWRIGRGCFLVLLVVAGGLGCTKAQFERIKPLDAGQPVDAPMRDAATPDLPATPGVCAPGTARASKGKAESCSCDDECQTGFCADGLCCSSACGEKCKACNLRSSLGDCVLVPSGVTPTEPKVCAASTPATCGQDGTCDGKGECRLFVSGTECKPGQCDGDQVANVKTCDGKGSCSQTTSQICSPYSCNPSTNRCATSCTPTNDLCAAGEKCVGERCGPSTNGALCQAASDCASGYCVDGVCCNIACSGPCVTCNQIGSVGRCTYLPAGLSDDDCQAAAPSTCGPTGLCDGFGSCTLYPENSVCGPSTCSGLEENTPRTCDGRGTCRPPELVNCAPFLCSNGACQTRCDPKKADSCETGHQCVAQTVNGATVGICGQRKNGVSCADASECESKHCVDGVCCADACEGDCRSCNLAGSPGQCRNVAQNAPDPRKNCQDLGASKCSFNGRCDGQGSCQKYPLATQCGEQRCVGGAHTPAPTCNAAGQCVAPDSSPCKPYVCNTTNTCFNACSKNSQCTDAKPCVRGSCGLKALGALCNSGRECESAICSQGVCCNFWCTAACTACNLPGSMGRCTTVADRTPDPQGKCVPSGFATCGTTGLCQKGKCGYTDQGQSCAPAECATSSSVILTSTCDGKGACIKPAIPNSCGSFTCDSGACKTSCTPATEAQDCVPPNTCTGNSCGRKVNGAPCTSPVQCQSGFCTEGVCCDSACADAPTGGLCKTCQGVGSSPKGTCAFVASGEDPNSHCSASAIANGDCSNDGTCNGAGACRAWPTGTGCRPESCTGTSHTLPATCNASGICPTVEPSSCGSYVCSTSSPSCLTTCTSDADCSNNLTCLQTANRCGDKLAAGETCVASSDCATGLVCSAEGVCCDQTCAGGCQSCQLAGKAGICSSIVSGSPPRATNSPTCTAAAPGACGQSGNCDGSNGCEKRTTCTSDITACPSDLHQQFIPSGVCGQTGLCTPLTTGCNIGYLCIAGGACASSCTPGNASTNCDVAAGYSCIDGLCKKKANGTSCSQGSECVNGNCVDGVCCAAASCSDCLSCNVSGHEGACWAVAQGSSDGACVAQCPVGSNQSSGLCDGSGACRTASACPGGNLCGSDNLCATNCSTVGCSAGFYCSGTTCQALKTDGSTCAGNGECTHGHCITDGTTTICCSTTCTDVTCSTRALCNTSGSGCQTYASGITCTAGSAACSTDGHSSLASTGTCASGACEPTSTACTTGYLCVGSACVAPGGCTLTSGCDTASGYACTVATGNCDPL